MTTKAYVTASALIFALVALGHLIRLMEGWPVQVGSYSFPAWASLLAILVTASVSMWGLSLLRRYL